MQPEELVPIVAVLGFAIQQFSQVIVDPLASMAIALWKRKCTEQPGKLRCCITDVDAKKAIIGLVSFGLGLAIALTGMVRVLETSGVKGFPTWDIFVTALTIS